ncbi:MAG TPA: prepilin-type N-terminal cleavage/methylation domain-containing protein [Acidimicrobiia bacterium]
MRMDIRRLELELARQARRKRQAGMTLIELLTTLAIVGSLAGIAVPKYHEIADAARVTQAIGDISAIQTTLDTRDSLPDNLAGIGQNLVDPWGNPYVYVKFPNGSPRVDRFGVPLNTTYDLYSVGKDNSTSGSLNSSVSFDDVVRANDGGFLGQGSRF